MIILNVFGRIIGIIKNKKINKYFSSGSYDVNSTNNWNSNLNATDCLNLIKKDFYLS